MWTHSHYTFSGHLGMVRYNTPVWMLLVQFKTMAARLDLLYLEMNQSEYFCFNEKEKVLREKVNSFRFQVHQCQDNVQTEVNGTFPNSLTKKRNWKTDSKSAYN